MSTLLWRRHTWNETWTVVFDFWKTYYSLLCTLWWSPAHGAPTEHNKHVPFTLMCHTELYVDFKMNTLFHGEFTPFSLSVTTSLSILDKGSFPPTLVPNSTNPTSHPFQKHTVFDWEKNLWSDWLTIRVFFLSFLLPNLQKFNIPSAQLSILWILREIRLILHVNQ